MKNIKTYKTYFTVYINQKQVGEKVRKKIFLWLNKKEQPDS